MIHPITMKLLRMEHSHSSLLSSSNDVERWRPDCNIGCFSHSKPPFAKPNNINLPSSRKLQVMLQEAIVLSLFRRSPLSSTSHLLAFLQIQERSLFTVSRIHDAIATFQSYGSCHISHLYVRIYIIYVVCNAFGCRLCIWLPGCSTSFHDLQQQVGCVVCFSPIGDNWRTRLRQCLDLGMESVGYSFGVKWSARRGGINKEKMFA